MKGKRVKFVVEISLDPHVGWGHDPEDFRRHIERWVMETVPHYDPVVDTIPTEPVAPACGLRLGDRVRVVNNESSPHIALGAEGVVVNDPADVGYVLVRFDTLVSNFEVLLDLHEVEVHEPVEAPLRVGDRVRVVDNCTTPNIPVGTVGVINTDPKDRLYLSVKFPTGDVMLYDRDEIERVHDEPQIPAPVEYDPEFERLLREEEEIERQSKGTAIPEGNFTYGGIQWEVCCGTLTEWYYHNGAVFSNPSYNQLHSPVYVVPVKPRTVTPEA